MLVFAIISALCIFLYFEMFSQNNCLDEVTLVVFFVVEIVAMGVSKVA